MINLMPIEEKKKIRKVFFLRLLMVSFLMLSFAFFIIDVAILPSFIISFGKERLAFQKLEVERSQKVPEVNKEAQKTVDELNIKLETIEKAIKSKYVFSEKIINEIVHQKTAGIKITKITYENDQFKGRKVIVSGIANNREQLLLFRKSLENSSVFKSVNLPISNFVKDRDIQFSLELIAL